MWNYLTSHPLMTIVVILIVLALLYFLWWSPSKTTEDEPTVVDDDPVLRAARLEEIDADGIEDDIKPVSPVTPSNDTTTQTAGLVVLTPIEKTDAIQSYYGVKADTVKPTKDMSDYQADLLNSASGSDYAPTMEPDDAPQVTLTDADLALSEETVEYKDDPAAETEMVLDDPHFNSVDYPGQKAGLTLGDTKKIAKSAGTGKTSISALAHKHGISRQTVHRIAEFHDVSIPKSSKKN